MVWRFDRFWKWRQHSWPTDNARHAIESERDGATLTRPRIGITAGDPAGIGPEIAVKVAADPEVQALCEPIIYGPSSDAEVAAFQRGVVTPASLDGP